MCNPIREINISALEREANQLDQECIKIQQDIDATDFKDCDRDWLSRARAAMKIKRRRFNQIKEIIGAERRAQRQAAEQEKRKTFDFLFRTEAKRILSDDLYAEIVAAAQERESQGVAA